MKYLVCDNEQIAKDCSQEAMTNLGGAGLHQVTKYLSAWHKHPLSESCLLAILDEEVSAYSEEDQVEFIEQADAELLGWDMTQILPAEPVEEEVE